MKRTWASRRAKRAKKIASASLWLAVLLVVGIATTRAEDWPEFRGKGRLGVWNETGIIEKFPETGLKVLWRTPIKNGYTGPSVADGRVFVTDFSPTVGKRGIERALALDEKTGRILWTHEWPADYAGISWAYGPRATPTVDGDRVYVAGGASELLAFDVKTGAVLWQKNLIKEYGGQLSSWGYASAPLVDGERLICLVGGEPDARVMAFDKMTGKEIWRALPVTGDSGVTQPTIITAGGTRQLIMWDPFEVVSLDPVTGKVYWKQPFRVNASMTVATPVQSGPLLFVSTFYNGPLMMKLDESKPGATVLWKGKSESEIQTDGLHAVIATPVIEGDYIYGICSYGQFRCIRVKNGERVWETQDVTKERRRWVSGFIVRHGTRYFINNDRGELMIAKLSPAGYQEISRTQMIKPTTPPENRRERTYVNWVHPAYANKHLYTRNDEEIICYSLAADGT
jgi:outer membrane protein assembly factor BamB